MNTRGSCISFGRAVGCATCASAALILPAMFYIRCYVTLLAEAWGKCACVRGFAGGLRAGAHLIVGQAMAHNKHLAATLIDNWSEFAESDAREDFFRHINKLISTYPEFSNPRINYREQDCFTLTEDQVDGKFDLYLYDADHSYEAQEKGITYFEKFFTPQVIICVDDFNWEASQKGTKMGLGYLTMSGWKVEGEWFLTGENWWNGYGVFLLRRGVKK